MNIWIVQHEAFETPGAILDWAKTRNHKVAFSKVFEEQTLPANLENIDLLIVMGGPQGPSTTKGECSYFDAEAEKAFILKAMDKGKAVLGICLGAQLIGEALGAKCVHSPSKEIGVFPIQLTQSGLEDSKLSDFGTGFPVGHWHGDMPGLTPTSKILATSEGCPRQIIKYSERVYGFQCHLEFTPSLVELLIAQEKDFLERSNLPYVQKPEKIKDFNYLNMNEKLFTFLDKLIETSVERP